MANLMDDIGAAVVQTIKDNASLFTSVGATGGVLHVEYKAPDNTQLPAGAAGRIVVSPVAQNPVDGTEFEESAESQFDYDLLIDIRGVRTSHTVRTAVMQALHSSFRENGAAMFSDLTDNGTNRLGASGEARLGALQERDTVPDMARVTVPLTVFCWHKLPMA